MHKWKCCLFGVFIMVVTDEKSKMFFHFRDYSEVTTLIKE